LLVYRTEGYQSLRSRVEKLSKKLERKKEAPTTISNKKSKEKRIAQYEHGLESANKELNYAEMKSAFAVGLTLISLFGILNSQFGGKVVAKLPFEPWPLVRSISHRGLSGTDFTDCSMAFMYALCSISIRTNLQKLLGFAPPKLIVPPAAGAG